MLWALRFKIQTAHLQSLYYKSAMLVNLLSRNGAVDLRYAEGNPAFLEFGAGEQGEKAEEKAVISEFEI